MISVTRINTDKAPVRGPIASLPIGGGFLFAGKLHIRSGADKAFCPENAAEFASLADFGSEGNDVELRDVEYRDGAEIAE